MPPLLELEPPSLLEFPLSGAGPACARLRLTNVSGALVAYKVKSTASRSYAIRPSAGSIRRGEAAEVQIARKAEEEAPAAAPQRRADRFLVQAAVVDSDEKKLLLHAAQRGKAAGAAKFWDAVPREALEERQLVAAFVEAGGAAGAPAGAPGGAPAGPPAAKAAGAGESRRAGGARAARAPPGHGREGMPSNEDVDAILGKLSLPGRSQPAPAAAPPEHAARGPPGLGGADWPVEAAGAAGPSPDAAAPAALPAAVWKKPSAAGKRKDDVVLQRHSRPVTFVALHPSGQEIYSCGKDKAVIAWSSPGGEFLRCYEGHRGAVWACSVSPDGLLLLTCGADSLVLLWDASSAQQLADVQMPGVVRWVEWAPQLGSHQLGLRRFVACSNSFKSHPAALALSEFGEAASPEGPIIEARRLLAVEEPTLPSGATQVAWAGPDAGHLCSVHASGRLLFWRAGDGLLQGQLEAHDGPVSQVAFARDHDLMASCGRTDMQVKLWDLSSFGQHSAQPVLLRSFLSDRPLNAVALRPSLSRAEADAGAGAEVPGAPGRWDCLAGGGQDAREVALVGAGTDDQFDPVPLRLGTPGSLEAADAASEDAHRGGGHFGPIHALAFSLEGSLCVSGSEDGNVRIRELSAEAVAPRAAPQAPQQSVEALVAEGAARVSPQGAARQALPRPPQSGVECRAQPAAQQPSQSIAGQSSGQPAGALLRAVAIADFDPTSIGWPAAAPQRPLPLRRGQELEVAQDAGSGWTWGRAVGNPAALGLLPSNYVLPLSTYQELLRRASARPQEAAPPAQEPAGGEAEEEGDCSQS